MCCSRRRWHRAKFGVLLIVIGFLWLGERAGWVPLEIFGPLVLLTLGVWVIATSDLQKRHDLPQRWTNDEGLENGKEE
jgi:hypothetical protein